ncbi:MAG: flippase activity-associated protein Agl23 [Pyrinomonadaceae bacterium]
MTLETSDKSVEGYLEVLNREKYWLICSGLITLVAFLLRFIALDLRPFHHDEGVNGFFMKRLFKEGVYQYDPANYHGPDLYYFALAVSNVFGLNSWSVRATVAIFGVLTVVLVFYLRRYIGTYGSLFAAFLLAISPGMVFISRYFIHEMLFVFFSLAFVVALLLFIEKKEAGLAALGWMTLIIEVSLLPSILALAQRLAISNPTLRYAFYAILVFAVTTFSVFIIVLLKSWNNGRPIYFLLASASLALLFATKETAFITIGTMGIALVCVIIWRKIWHSKFYVKNPASANLIFFGGGAFAILVLGAIFYYRVYSFYTWVRFEYLSPTALDYGNVSYIFLLFAFGCTLAWIYYFIKNYRNSEWVDESDGFLEPTFSAFRNAFGKHPILLVSIAFLVFAYLGVLFFSSFFTYKAGIGGAFEAYAVWTKTGSKDHTQNGLLGFVKWMTKIELPIVLLAALGSLVALLRGRDRFALFSALWAFGLFLAYTIIPYKTPWLALSFLLPMCIIAGYGIECFVRERSWISEIIISALVALSVFVLSFQTYDLNFIRYDSDRMPYVYAHTERGFLQLIDQINNYSRSTKLNELIGISVVSPDYWSMPWYTRDYAKVYYSGELDPAANTELIIASRAQREDAIKTYGSNYRYVGSYPLRPGITLDLLVRKDVAQYQTKPLSDIPK